MKVLVDTCGWIEWITGSTLAGQFEPYLKNSRNLIVPTIVQFELYKWLCRERDEMLAVNIIGVTEQSTVIGLDTTLALFAADLAKQHNLAMADAIVYGCARLHQAALVTSDQHFRELPQVKCFSKQK